MKFIAILLSILSTFLQVSDARCKCEYDYNRVGCFKVNRNSRTLPKMLANERDKYSKYYNGHEIDWFNWRTYMPAMVCRCAGLAIKKGYKYFAIQSWGECWGGLTADEEYDKNGEGGACYGPEFGPCKEDDINCVGAISQEFVYEIATYTCDVNFEKIGCYNNYSRENELVLTARDHSSEEYTGSPINWWNFDIFLPKFACECAKKVAKKGNTIFGMQYYGECWAGAKIAVKYYRGEGRSKKCVNKCFEKCKRWNRFCIGEGFASTVYRITHPQCELKYKGLGCYNATDKENNTAMSEFLFTEVSPESEKFNSHMLKFDDSWDKMYPHMLCRCAHAALDKGYDHFSIRNKGECWSGSNSGKTYKMHAQSDTCVRKQSEQCKNKIECAGSEDSISVYKLLGRAVSIGR